MEGRHPKEAETVCPVHPADDGREYSEPAVRRRRPEPEMGDGCDGVQADQWTEGISECNL